MQFEEFEFDVEEITQKLREYQESINESIRSKNCVRMEQVTKEVQQYLVSIGWLCATRVSSEMSQIHLKLVQDRSTTTKKPVKIYCR